MRGDGGAPGRYAIRPLEDCAGKELEKQLEEVMDEMAEEAEDVPEEARRVKKVLNPHLPTDAEREEHGVTHLPYRNWCRHCVRGRGKEAAHQGAAADHVNGVGEFSLDYAFPATEGGDGMTLLIVRERATRMTCSMQVPRKGSTGLYASKRVVAFIREVGYEDCAIIMKTDGEAALKAVVDEVAKMRGHAKTVREEAPKGASQSNGIIERAVQSVVGQLRVMKDALETKWESVIPDRHPVMSWMTEYASVLLNRCEVGKDGKTAYERMKGKRATVLGIEFGEQVHMKRFPTNQRLSKLSIMWSDAIFLGVRTVSGEVIVGTKEGIWKTRTVTRKPVEERWSKDAETLVGGVPWKMSADDEEADGVMEKFGLGAKMTAEDEQRIAEEVKETVPRRFLIQKRDLDAHGYSKDCAGCRAALGGRVRQAHSEECRKRLMEMMAGSEKVKAARGREDEFLSKVLEKEDQARKRKADREADRESVDAETKVEPAGVETNMNMYMDWKLTGGRRQIEEASGSGDPKRMKAAPLEKRERTADGFADEDPKKTRINGLAVNDEEDDEAVDWAVDDNSGKALDPKEVRMARREELAFMEKLGVFVKVDREEAMIVARNKPTTVKWIDTNKGTEAAPMVRSRLVARDFKGKDAGREDLFAATPPWEMVKGMLVLARQTAGVNVMLIGVRKAHLNGKVKLEEDGRHFIELPEGVQGRRQGRRVEAVALWHEAGRTRVGGRLRRQPGEDRDGSGQGCSHGVLEQDVRCEVRGPWRRLHVHR